MPTPQKEARVAALKERLAQSAGLYLSDFSGIDAAGMARLRNQVSEAGGKVEVVKNRLLKLALAGTDVESLAEHLTGPTAVTFCAEDSMGPGKAMRDFARTLTDDKQRWVIKAAFVDGRLFADAQAEALADLPPVEEIRSAAVGGIAGPLNAVVFALNGVMSDLVLTLEAVADKRREQAA